MKKHIKAFAAICSLAMVFSIFSSVVTASDVNIYDVDQQFITDNDGFLPKDDGMYTLIEDITVDKTTQIDTANITVGINLNGHKITYNGSGSMYIVGKVNSNGIVAGNVHLIIGDGAGGGEITTGDDYDPTLGGSKDYWISGSFATNSTANDGRGGCILLSNSCDLAFTGGKISGFHARDEGGAIHVTNGSTLRMTGGTITNCSAKNGGAISVHTSSKGETSTINGQSYNLVGTAIITGGKITGNTAEINGGGITAFRGNVLLSNCEITDNTANGSNSNEGGGGVHFGQTVDMDQGFLISGNVQIHDNNGKNANRADLFFGEKYARTATLCGNLDPDSKIVFGFGSQSNVGADFSFFKIDGFSYDIKSFVSANNSKVPYYDSASDSIKLMAATNPAIKGYTASVAGNISLNTFVDLGTYANSGTTVSYEYSYTKSGTTKNVSKTLNFSDLELDSGSGYYTFPIPVESACMTAPIKVTVTYGNNLTVNNGNGITVEEYAKVIINGNDPAYTSKAKAIARALIIFGGYAQKQFDINTDALPVLDGVNFDRQYADAISGAAFTPTGDDDGAFAGATLSLLSETSVNLYFKKSVLGSSAPEMTVLFGNTEVQPTVTTKGSYYVYTIAGRTGSGFLATQYNDTFSFSVNGISGNYSVLTYLQAAKNNTANAQTLINLIEAYYNFTQVCSN